MDFSACSISGESKKQSRHLFNKDKEVRYEPGAMHHRSANYPFSHS